MSLDTYLIELFKKNLQEIQKKKIRNDPFTVHISDIDDFFCLRKVLLCAREGINWRKKPSFSTETLLTFRIGEKLEEITRECLEGKKGTPFILKIGKFKIVGSPDIIVRYKDLNYIIENKSIKKSDFLLLERPISRHVFQLSFYLFIANKYYSNFAEEGYLVYIPKEHVSPFVKIYKIPLNSGIEKSIEKFIKTFVKAIRENKLPQMKHCPDKHCPVIDECLKRREE